MLVKKTIWFITLLDACFGEQRHGDVGPRMPLDRMPFIAEKAHLAFFNSILYKCCYTTNWDKVWEMVVLMHISMLSPREGSWAYVGHLIFWANFQSNASPLGNKYWSNTPPFCNKLQ
jgi:hypothetical protein